MGRRRARRAGLSFPNPTPLLEKATGNWMQRALAAATSHGLFTYLSTGEATLEEIGAFLQASGRPTRMLVDVLTAAGLLRRRKNRISLSPLAREYLVEGGENYLGHFILMTDERLYLPWKRLEEAIRSNSPQVDEYRGPIPSSEEIQEKVRRAIMGLHGITTLAARSFCRMVDLGTFSRVLELGGGTGAFSIAMALAFPHLEFTILDLGPVCRVTEEMVRKKNLQERITILESDFFTADYPGSHDLVVISNVLHDWNREQCLVLLRRSFDHLPPGGMVIINEWLLRDDRSGPLLSALMSLDMLIETHGGENLTGAQIQGMLRDAGFSSTEVLEILPPHGVVLGRR